MSFACKTLDWRWGARVSQRPGRANDPQTEAFIDGDPAAVAAVVGWIRRAVASPGFRVPYDERGELIQESLLQVWKQLSERRTHPDSLEALARSVARRRCVDWIRRRVIAEKVDVRPAPDERSPEDSLLARERAEVGCRVLAELRESCRELIHQHAMLGLTFREISETQGRLEKTVRNQMYKCLEQARRIVQGYRRREKLGLRPFDR